MNNYLCINCWRITETRDLLANCTSCVTEAAPNRTDWRRPPPEFSYDLLRPLKTLQGKQNWLQRINEQLQNREQPLCPQHTDRALNLYCQCGSFLSPRARSSHQGQQMAARIIGPPSSGKTLLLISFQESLIQHSNIPIDFLPIGKTELRFKAFQQRFFNHRQQPAPTGSHHGSSDNSGFLWEITLRGNVVPRYSLIATHDRAGEDWEQLNYQRSDNFNRYLRIPGDLIFIIDGATMAADLALANTDNWDSFAYEADQGAKDRDLFARLIDTTDKSQLLRMRLALVITKADLLWSYPEYKWLQATTDTSQNDINQDDLQQMRFRELLDRSGRGSIYSKGQEFEDLKVFATSSIGFTPTRVDNEGRLLEAPKPTQVHEPFLWLLDLDEKKFNPKDLRNQNVEHS